MRGGGAAARAGPLTSSPGGRKRDAFYYDLWTLKYLPKFKWEHLTEELGA